MGNDGMVGTETRHVLVVAEDALLYGERWPDGDDGQPGDRVLRWRSGMPIAAGK